MAAIRSSDRESAGVASFGAAGCWPDFGVADEVNPIRLGSPCAWKAIVRIPPSASTRPSPAAAMYESFAITMVWRTLLAMATDRADAMVAAAVAGFVEKCKEPRTVASSHSGGTAGRTSVAARAAPSAVTPRRASRWRRTSRARAIRLRTVPTGHRSRRAASSCDIPSR